MTISSLTNRVTTNGNGSTTAFPFPYAFHAKADLIVLSTVITTGVETEKDLTTDYTISGTPDALGHYSSGGTVNFLVAPASTVRITIYRSPTRTQLLDLADASAFPAESVEAQFDYVTMLIQRLAERVNRTLAQPDGDTLNVEFIPSKVDRASMYLGFDSDGDPVALDAPTDTSITTAFSQTLLDDANAATARATLSAVGLSGDETVAGVKTLSSNPVVSGGGVQFPAVAVPSADVNCLDDYEEGSWTPSVGGDATYTARAGKYVKIGRLVWASFTLTISVLEHARDRRAWHRDSGRGHRVEFV
jgi:hypothetical protein